MSTPEVGKGSIKLALPGEPLQILMFSPNLLRNETQVLIFFQGMLLPAFNVGAIHSHAYFFKKTTTADMLYY